jgi:hypothetical protein
MSITAAAVRSLAWTLLWSALALFITTMIRNQYFQYFVWGLLIVAVVWIVIGYLFGDRDVHSDNNCAQIYGIAACFSFFAALCGAALVFLVLFVGGSLQSSVFKTVSFGSNPSSAHTSSSSTPAPTPASDNGFQFPKLR